MLDTPRLAQSSAQHTAVIHLVIPRHEIQAAMGPAFSELMAALHDQGITPAGAWFSHHLRMDPGIFDFEVGLPVAAPIRPVGRVVPGEMPARAVLRTVLHGGYDGLGAAWQEFADWGKASGHQTAPDMWEVYVAGPESGPDPAGYHTELNRPLAV
jgi:effector-binding domain-containing protein